MAWKVTLLRRLVSDGVAELVSRASVVDAGDLLVPDEGNVDNSQRGSDLACTVSWAILPYNAHNGLGRASFVVAIC